jgi:hypothetical protein
VGQSCFGINKVKPLPMLLRVVIYDIDNRDTSIQNIVPRTYFENNC